MSKLSFVKYHGAGNDFILIDHRAPFFNPALVPLLCDRHLGIGADGVILLELHPTADFQMRIFNCDGSEAESCGNGLRCLLRFITRLGFPEKAYQIATGNQMVEGSFEGNKVSVKMGLSSQSMKEIAIRDWQVYTLNTGVPHAVLFVPQVKEVDVKQTGAFLRHHPYFSPRGTNVNFASLNADGSLSVRTYERGVEGETLACGTGAIAVGLAATRQFHLPSPIQIHFPGGSLSIFIEKQSVKMVGESCQVFEGDYSLATAKR